MLPDAHESRVRRCDNPMKGKTGYYMRLARLYSSYRRRDVIVPAPFLRLWVEISSRCNLRCAACPNKDLPEGQKGDMEWALFKKVIDQGRASAFEINLYHRGETLLHQDAGRFIQYAARPGIFSRLHTNATLLKGKVSDEILLSGLQRLSVSFDGFSADVYEKNRCGANFEEVSQNIIDFLQRRRQLRKKNPRLAIEVMELSPKIVEKQKRREFFDRFKKLGLDEIVVKKPHNWAGYLGVPGSVHRFSACTFPWNALLIFFNGDVLPCAQDFFGRGRLGSAYEKLLLDIWNDLPMQELRRAFAAGQFSAFPACTNCDRISRPTLGGLPREFLKRLLFRRMP